jgi:hypothetical protein
MAPGQPDNLRHAASIDKDRIGPRFRTSAAMRALSHLAGQFPICRPFVRNLGYSFVPTGQCPGKCVPPVPKFIDPAGESALHLFAGRSGAGSRRAGRNRDAFAEVG